jgi:hypothetical protein
VNNNFEELKKTYCILGGQEELKSELDLLAKPVAVEMKLSEIFDLFSLANEKNEMNFSYIKKIVESHLDEFNKNFGNELIENKDLIHRLYSACYTFLKTKQQGEIINRREVERFMYGKMLRMKTEKSFGCSASTRVGSYGESIGYFVTSDGKVNYGKIPDGYKECKKCGCWYIGSKCPFC